MMDQYLVQAGHKPRTLDSCQANIIRAVDILEAGVLPEQFFAKNDSKIPDWIVEMCKAQVADAVWLADKACPAYARNGDRGLAYRQWHETQFWLFEAPDDEYYPFSLAFCCHVITAATGIEVTVAALRENCKDIELRAKRFKVRPNRRTPYVYPLGGQGDQDE